MELNILSNEQNPVCTLYVQVSFTAEPPSLRNLCKTVVRANTVTKGHGNLAVQYFRYIQSDYNLCEVVGEQMYRAKIPLQHILEYFLHAVTPFANAYHIAKFAEKRHTVAQRATLQHAQVHRTVGLHTMSLHTHCSTLEKL